jgi:hypothetical protein
MKAFRVICLAGAVFGAVCVAEAALDTAKIDEIIGLKGKLNAQEAVYKVTFARDDVKVSVTGSLTHDARKPADSISALLGQRLGQGSG